MIVQRWSCEEKPNHIPSTMQISLSVLKTVIGMNMWKTKKEIRPANVCNLKSTVCICQWAMADTEP